MTSEELIEKLQHSICQITFEKADGSIRTMICTLDPEYLPETSTTTEHKADCVTVFDLEENSWRAFKPSRLLSIIL